MKHVKINNDGSIDLKSLDNLIALLEKGEIPEDLYDENIREVIEDVVKNLKEKKRDILDIVQERPKSNKKSKNKNWL